MPIKAVSSLLEMRTIHAMNIHTSQSSLDHGVSTDIQPALELGIPEGHMVFYWMHQGFENVPMVKNS